jgi:acetyltransferase-like isoleucine patch superfamily enzyme
MFRTYKTNINNIDQLRFFPKINGRVKLGDFSYINQDAEVRCWRPSLNASVEIGKYCSIGKCYFIIDGNHNPHFASTYPFKELWISSKAPENVLPKHIPIVENDVWIADEAFIYSGVTIHNGAIVAGNSVVTKDVPPYAVVAGNPAKVVKYRFDKNTIDRFQKVKWWDLSNKIVTNHLAPLIHNTEEFLDKAESFRK